MLTENPVYQNITLTGLSGDVLASGLPTKAVNLRDRKHVRTAIHNKIFSAGEYIVTRVGVTVPSFAFAHPVIGQDSRVTGVLTTSINLEHLLRLFDHSTLPEKSFIAATDHRGIRLFYFPPNEKTNPVGTPIMTILKSAA